MGKFHCLFINVGTPKSTKKRDVSSFLRRYLMDSHVMRMPWLSRAMLVNGVIIPRRKAHSSDSYKSVWRDGEKSPLVVNTERLIEKVEAKLREKENDTEVSFAMRHGEPSIKSEIKRLSKMGVDRLLVIPMYPQYEESTYQSAIDEVRSVVRKYPMKVQFVPPFYAHGDYIAALERSIREGLFRRTVDRVVFSFHGVPLKYNPREYRAQCEETARLVTINLGILEGEFDVVFQSRSDRSEWLSPSLTNTLRELPKQGVRSVAVVAPSFPADCLETLYEVDIEARRDFLAAGGEEFIYVSALNDLDLWAKKLSKWIIQASK
ncbi:MAG: ferrochelatase [Rikenellaceae bacterium]